MPVPMPAPMPGPTLSRSRRNATGRWPSSPDCPRQSRAPTPGCLPYRPRLQPSRRWTPSSPPSPSLRGSPSLGPSPCRWPSPSPLSSRRSSNLRSSNRRRSTTSRAPHRSLCRRRLRRQSSRRSPPSRHPTSVRSPSSPMPRVHARSRRRRPNRRSRLLRHTSGALRRGRGDDQGRRRRGDDQRRRDLETTTPTVAVEESTPVAAAEETTPATVVEGASPDLSEDAPVAPPVDLAAEDGSDHGHRASPGRPSTVPAVTLSWREAESFDIGLPDVEDDEGAILVEPPSQMVAVRRRRREHDDPDAAPSPTESEVEPEPQPEPDLDSIGGNGRFLEAPLDPHRGHRPAHRGGCRLVLPAPRRWKRGGGAFGGWHGRDGIHARARCRPGGPARLTTASTAAHRQGAAGPGSAQR